MGFDHMLDLPEVIVLGMSSLPLSNLKADPMQEIFPAVTDRIRIRADADHGADEPQLLLAFSPLPFLGFSIQILQIPDQGSPSFRVNVQIGSLFLDQLVGQIIMPA